MIIMTKRKITLERTPYLLLNIGLPFILAVFAYITYYLITADADSVSYITFRAGVMVEYMQCAAACLFGGAMLLDYVIKKNREQVQ